MSHWKTFLDAEARGGRYLPWKEVGRATGLSRTTAWRLQKRGEFPAPYAISPGRVGYREDEVEAWRVSRDHSGARVKSPTGAGGDAPPAVALSTAVPRREITAPPVAMTSSGEVSATLAAPALVARSLAPRAAGVPTTKRGKPGRRRSQHAQAIAQQILFDF
ncbi:AlpA family transcriptional regulator [uncultured Phenylobacterium sp.]|uniref:helix-turn-helix transcriptional regulator n=1 Tax=uncultured Phenylobacterium sp. TaxID=349273 RepID=UPI0025DA273B|nr:AlpA family phage regulatory protein [uncultured Phenylobacterium sp.]